MRRTVHVAALTLLLGLTLQLAAPATARAVRRAQLGRVERLLSQWRTAEAAAALAPLLRRAPRDPRVLQLQGEVLLNQGRYDEANRVLRQAVSRSRSSHGLKVLRDLARSSAETVKGYVKHRSPEGNFELWTTPGKDELLVPFAARTLEAMRAALKHDLGYAPPAPVRVEIYPSTDDLARVSPLSRADIRRSGTIALCKFDRLMAVSPRALLRGYGWRDTLAHEYVHLVISRVSHNAVPIWLHEGLAKVLETRWREPAGRPAPLTPAQEHLLARALRKGKLISWRQMHPSMAKLPSQEATSLAFAQVQTAVELLVQRISFTGLRQMLRALRDGSGTWDALRDAAKLSRKGFIRAWKQDLRARKLRTLDDLVPQRMRFGKKPSREQRVAALRQSDAKRYLRLAQLLRSRRLTQAAIIEYKKARAILGPRDDLVANQLARAYLEVASPAQAINALMPVLEYYPELPGPQVTIGIAYLRNRAPDKAAEHLQVALRINPFDPELHCGLAQALRATSSPELSLHRELCRKLQQ